jgi:hypothetical protein
VAVRNGQGWAVRFYLESKGRHRGWGHRIEITGADGEPLLTAKEREVQEGVEQAKKIIEVRREPRSSTRCWSSHPGAATPRCSSRCGSRRGGWRSTRSRGNR